MSTLIYSTAPSNFHADSKKVLGVPLDELVARDGIPIPFIVKKVVRHIEDFGLDQVGIYRINGNVKVIEKLRESFDRGLSIVEQKLMKYTLHVLCHNHFGYSSFFMRIGYKVLTHSTLLNCQCTCKSYCRKISYVYFSYKVQKHSY